MTELSALNVRITGNAEGLEAALSSASGDLRAFQAQAARTTGGVAGLGTGVARMGQVFTRNRSAIQNVSYQLQDFVVQVAAGTRASTAAAMQLPQLASGFGAVGAVIGTLAAVGIPLLAAAFFDAREEAASTEDVIESLRGQIDLLDDANDILGLSQEELIERFGRHAEAARDAAQATRELAAASAQARLAEVITEASDAMREFTQTEAGLFRSGTTMAQAISNVAEEFGISRNEAREFAEALFDLRGAMSFEDRVAALNQIRDVMEQAGISADMIPEALRQALIEAGNLIPVMAELANEAERAAQFGMTAGTPLSGVVLPGDETPSGGRRRTGGGGGARANPLVAQLEQLRQSLMSQAELELANYQTRQEMLQSALEQRLLTQQEYAALMEAEQSRHADRMGQLDVWQYGSALDRADAFLGSMAQAFSSGNERMLEISKAFGAAQALISAWQGAAEALKLPFPANLAAFAQVLSTGLGAVQAIKGVGRGGSGGGAAVAGGGASAAQPSQRVFVNITGDSVPVSSLQGLFDQINSGLSRGMRLDGIYQS